MAKPLVVIFARAPLYGAVKTRLARDIGACETIRFYRDTLGLLVRRLMRDGRFDVAIAVTPDTATRARGIWPKRVRVTGQGGGDLGRRMMRAMRRAGARPVLVIGSDIPDIRAAHAISAFRALARAPYVLGPARDGGYWLIGARHPSRLRLVALDGVCWSSATTMRETIDRLGSVEVLPQVLDDVDDGEAFRRIATRAR